MKNAKTGIIEEDRCDKIIETDIKRTSQTRESIKQFQTTEFHFP